MSLWSRLKSGLSRSSDALGSSLSGLMGGKKLSPETLGELEDALIMADLGVATAAAITENLRARRDLAELDDAALRAALAQEISALLQPVEKPFACQFADAPSVILLAGVNGAGKTTTIGKLAKKFQAEGKSVMLAACDTFRAAAAEQLQVLGRARQCAGDKRRARGRCGRAGFSSPRTGAGRENRHIDGRYGGALAIQ